MNRESVRDGYTQLGVDAYYTLHGSDYRNPHEPILHRLLSAALEMGLVGNCVLDLCCGSGEVTAVLKQCQVTGVDPYTGEAYFTRTRRRALPFSFKDISAGKLSGRYDSIICSFALHLCPSSMLPQVLWRLGELSDTLIVLSPHKRPDCDNTAGWILAEEIILERVRMRIYLR